MLLRLAGAVPSLRAAAGSALATHAPRWGATIGRPFSADADAPPTPAADAADAAPPSEDERAASLPPAQLAKALLAGNVRGQLTTVTAGQRGAEEPKVSSSVVSYVSLRGEAPVVLLRQAGGGGDASAAADAAHLANLGESSKASLATGHISPPWFVQRLRATGWLPRRVALLGSLQPLPAAEVRFAVSQARKACEGAPALAALLPGDDDLQRLAGFRLESISQAVYVDAAGRQQAVSPQELDSCLLDPLALPQHDLLAEINQAPDWQPQLQLFCMAYMGVYCSEVLLAEADRLGLTLLGRPPPGAPEAQGAQQAQQQRWRQFRIGSSRELRDAAAFHELLQQMRLEVKAASEAP